ncbi:MAG: hypothetical protein K1X71_08150 [Pirellulales bacterium]|nr:hypothetical protein [Pirellulales bacterium]
MADVALVFSGKTDDAEKAFRKLEQENNRLRESLKKTASQSKTAAAESTKGFQSQISMIGGLVGGLATVGTAVAVVTKAYGEWRREIESIDQKHRQFASELGRTLAQTGDLPHASKIQAALASVKGATRDESKAAFTSIRGALPTDEIGRVLGLTAHTARLAPILDPAMLGQVVGEFADLAPAKRPQDVVDLAVTALERSGNDAASLTEDGFLRSVKILKGAGMNTEQALGMGLASLDSKGGPKLLEQIAAIVEHPPELVQPKAGERMSADTALANKLAKMSKPEALKALLTDSAMQDAFLGKGAATKAGIFSIAKAMQEEQALVAGQRGDRAKDMLRQWGATPTGAVGLATHETSVRRERARMRREGAISEREMALDNVETSLIEGTGSEALAGLARRGVAASLTANDVMQSRPGRMVRQLGGALATGGSSIAIEAATQKITNLLMELVGVGRDQTAVLRHRNNRPLGVHSE